MKYIAVLFGLILILTGCNSNPAGIDDEYYNEAEEVFIMIETAYEEDRELTDREKNEIDKLLDKTEEIEDGRSGGELSEEEFAASQILRKVSSAGLAYQIVSNGDFMMANDESWERFNSSFDEARDYLENGYELTPVTEEEMEEVLRE